MLIGRERVGASESLAVGDAFVATAVDNSETCCLQKSPGTQRKQLHYWLRPLNRVTPFRWYSL